MIDPRKLVAIDIVFLGSKFIIAEFAGGVLLCLVLGTFVLFREDSFRQLALGLYLISLGINYVLMLPSFKFLRTSEHVSRSHAYKSSGPAVTVVCPTSMRYPSGSRM
jgi:hypothetical protein